MRGDTVSVLEGNIFVVSDRGGNIDAASAPLHGLFAWDTRLLSRWVLTVNGSVPQVLSTDDLHYYLIQFFLAPSSATSYVDPEVSIMRRRAVRAGMGVRAGRAVFCPSPL